MRSVVRGESVEIVEVGLRDGFQSIDTFIPTKTKLDVLRGLFDAGIRRAEATSFVSAAAVPQLADAADILAGAHRLPGLDAQVLVPTRRYAERALAAGAQHLAFVLSVSEAHNRSNVRRTPLESATEYKAIVAMAPPGTTIRLNLATAFDCPFDGPVDSTATLKLLDHLVDISPTAEIALCDTTGRTSPAQVGALFAAAVRRFPQVAHWVFHGHDTYGVGTANVLAAWDAGVSIFDASIAGLGGCPFAPGATGNVATEDIVWMFETMGVATSIDLDRLIAVARSVASLPGALTGGRVRDALAAKPCSAGIAA